MAYCLTASSSHGREILQQAVGYMRNVGVAAIGVSVPRELHGDLKQTLLQQARFHGKKLIYLNANVLGRILATVISRKRISLADL